MEQENRARIYIPHLGWMQYPEEDEVAKLLYRGYFEALEQAFLWRYLRSGDAVLDCGAHAGLYSILSSSLIGTGGVVIAFEPNTVLQSILDQNIRDRGCGNVTVEPFGLWDANATLPFSREPDGLSSHGHLVVDRSAVQDMDNYLEIAVKPLEEFSSLDSRALWHFLKIDCEGCEPRVLKGARSLIEQERVKLIMIEFNESNLQQFGEDTRSLFECIKQLGLKVYDYNASENRLEPYAYDSPIYYKNLFLTKDVSFINRRLKRASLDRSAIADDLTQRYRACSCFKELEDLRFYKERAGAADANQRWAEQTEKFLASERSRLQEAEASLRELESEAKQRARLEGELAAHKEATKQTLEAANESLRLAEARCDAFGAEHGKLEEQLLGLQKESDQALAAKNEELLEFQKESDQALAAKNEELLEFQKESDQALAAKNEESGALASELSALEASSKQTLEVANESLRLAEARCDALGAERAKLEEELLELQKESDRALATKNEELVALASELSALEASSKQTLEVANEALRLAEVRCDTLGAERTKLEEQLLELQKESDQALAAKNEELIACGRLIEKQRKALKSQRAARAKLERNWSKEK